MACPSFVYSRIPAGMTDDELRRWADEAPRRLWDPPPRGRRHRARGRHHPYPRGLGRLAPRTRPPGSRHLRGDALIRPAASTAEEKQDAGRRRRRLSTFRPAPPATRDPLERLRRRASNPCRRLVIALRQVGRTQPPACPSTATRPTTLDGLCHPVSARALIGVAPGIRSSTGKATAPRSFTCFRYRSFTSRPLSRTRRECPCPV